MNRGPALFFDVTERRGEVTRSCCLNGLKIYFLFLSFLFQFVPCLFFVAVGGAVGGAVRLSYRKRTRGAPFS